MDPYIDPDRLDPSHPLTGRKLDNLRRGDVAHRARARVTEALPAKIILQTTDQCNLDCPHCQIPRARKRPAMVEALLDRVVEELFPTLIELHPTNTGEPLVWAHFERLCTEMAAYGVLLDLTTNGTLLDERRLAWILPIARDVKVSMDGATEPTFERLRRGGSFAKVCVNIARLARATQPHTVALQMTLMRSNHHELVEMVRLAAGLGVRRVKAYHLFSFTPELDHESVVAEPEIWWPSVEAAQREADRLGVVLQAAEPSGSDAQLRRVVCHLPWHEAWIDLDGAVLPCHSHQGQAAGNILRAPFLECWNGPLYQQIRAGLGADRPFGACDGCGMNCERLTEGSGVPYDVEAFLSPEGRAGKATSAIRWSGRMRPFDLGGRR